jgi:serine/threonine protein kinase
VKLGDFGLSKRTGMTQLPSLAVGTPGFIAPDILEVLYRDGNTEPSVTIPHTKWVAGDLWSLGEVVVRIMSGRATFRSHEHMMQYSLQLKPFPNSELVNRRLSLDAVDFVQRVMTSQAKDRMTSKEGLLHDWIRLSIDPKSISIWEPRR